MPPLPNASLARLSWERRPIGAHIHRPNVGSGPAVSKKYVINLVENALRHTPSGTRIAIRAGSDGAGAFIAIEDNGPGVPLSDISRITDRFYRGESSRSTPGNGLGLSLVAAAASLHAAQLIIDRAEPGLRVMLRFPDESDPRGCHTHRGASLSRCPKPH